MRYANEELTQGVKPPLLIIFARGDKIRHITLRPSLASIWSFVIAVVTMGFLCATAYLFLSNDIHSALSNQRALEVHEYEARLVSLRSQLDRLNTDKSLQQRDVEQKVGELLLKQELLTERQERLNPPSGRISRTESNRSAPVVKQIQQLEKLPIPTPRPDNHALNARMINVPEIRGHAYASVQKLDVPWPLRTSRTDLAPAPTTAPAVAALGLSDTLEQVEQNQLRQIETLTEQAYIAAETIQEVLELTGISGNDHRNVGGPFIDLSEEASFEERMEELDEALSRLDDLKETAQRIPIISPLPGAKVTSRFGARKDPILNRVAYHSGMDFRATKGELIRATGAGTVSKAGWVGGYGRMVEIDHGSGITTRYAHLNEILVGKGEKVPAAGAIGRAGNSGRSTGPHLHYEIRRNGTALNPQKFITAGRQIMQIL